MTFAEIADRVIHTTEYVRVRLNAIYTDIRVEYEKTHTGNYKVSTIGEDEDGNSYKTQSGAETISEPEPRDTEDTEEPETV